MPGFLLHENAVVNCTHGAKATIVTTNKRVKVMGQAVAVVVDVTTVAGCPFQIPVGAGTKPSPCLKIQWSAPAARVKVMGQPVLVQSSVGLCQSPEQAPQGNAIVAGQQQRVKAQ